MADLCTTTDVTSRAPRLATHAALAGLISSASAMVENYCRRTFAYSASIVEYHNGDGYGRLWLKRLPFVSLSAVELSGSTIDVAQFTVNPDTGEMVWSSSPGDYRFTVKFPRGRRNIKVTYAGGYQTIPAPVVEATVQLVQQLADAAKVSGVYQSEEIGDYKYTLASNAGNSLPPITAQILAPYVLDVLF